MGSRCCRQGEPDRHDSLEGNDNTAFTEIPEEVEPGNTQRAHANKNLDVFQKDMDVDMDPAKTGNLIIIGSSPPCAENDKQKEHSVYDSWANLGLGLPSKAMVQSTNVTLPKTEYNEQANENTIESPRKVTSEAFLKSPLRPGNDNEEENLDKLVYDSWANLRLGLPSRPIVTFKATDDWAILEKPENLYTESERGERGAVIDGGWEADYDRNGSDIFDREDEEEPVRYRGGEVDSISSENQGEESGSFRSTSGEVDYDDENEGEGPASYTSGGGAVIDGGWEADYDRNRSEIFDSEDEEEWPADSEDQGERSGSFRSTSGDVDYDDEDEGEGPDSYKRKTSKETISDSEDQEEMSYSCRNTTSGEVDSDGEDQGDGRGISKSTTSIETLYDSEDQEEMSYSYRSTASGDDTGKGFCSRTINLSLESICGSDYQGEVSGRIRSTIIEEEVLGEKDPGKTLRSDTLSTVPVPFVVGFPSLEAIYNSEYQGVWPGKHRRATSREVDYDGDDES